MITSASALPCTNLFGRNSLLFGLNSLLFSRSFLLFSLSFLLLGLSLIFLHAIRVSFAIATNGFETLEPEHLCTNLFFSTFFLGSDFSFAFLFLHKTRILLLNYDVNGFLQDYSPTFSASSFFFAAIAARLAERRSAFICFLLFRRYVAVATINGAVGKLCSNVDVI